MSCFPFSPQNTAKELKKKLSSPRTAKTSKTEFPPFMNGNLTSTSTFELGDWENDSAIGEDTSSMKLMVDDESILASSQQNFNQDFSLAPSTIARNKVLACSTPKDQLAGNGAARAIFLDESPILMETPNPNPNINRDAARRVYNGLSYRNQRIRNLDKARPPRPPGTENIKNSYRMNKVTPFRRPISPEIEPVQEGNLEFLQRNLFEFITSILLALWQFFYAFGVIPSENTFVFYGTIVLIALYVLRFMANLLVWYALVGSLLLVYLGAAWMFQLTVNLGLFAFYIVLCKTVATVIHGVYLILS